MLITTRTLMATMHYVYVMCHFFILFFISFFFLRDDIRISLFSSPDWFTGLSNYRPVKDGKWLQSFSVDTYPWDAGTDSGTSYTSGNSATNPKERVYRIFYDLPENNVFIGDDGSVLPVGQWSCDKVKETECREDQGAKFFQKMKDGKLRTKKCRWLAKKIARKNRFCSKISTNVYAPSAGDVCRVTCETCPSISTDDD